MNEQMSLKEAILIRKMENDRSLKSKWDINRNLPRVGGRYTKSTAGKLFFVIAQKVVSSVLIKKQFTADEIFF